MGRFVRLGASAARRSPPPLGEPRQGRIRATDRPSLQPGSRDGKTARRTTIVGLPGVAVRGRTGLP
ncbi:hypothetical protein [Methylobacterium komagatae]|uniref:hypothetical protein n=1 Tax=Methylobacterium komagatae TaxID=374425 RepID=UPI00366FBA89